MTTTDSLQQTPVGAGSRPIIVRPALLHDVQPIVDLVNSYAARGEMLPKSLNKVYQNIRDFVVAEEEGRLIGCGALHVLWDDLAEIRSLAVVEGYQGRRVGAQIVQALLLDADRLEVPQVFALTYRPRFFERCGFTVVERETLPRKIWGDCIDCIKFPNCDEVAVVRDMGGQRC